jgi:hypothetical protein
MALDLAEIFAGLGDLAVFLDQRIDHIIHGDEIVCLRRHVPHAHAHDVVACPGLAFRHQGQQVLVAVGGDQIEGEVDPFLFGPFATERGQDLAGTRDPVVPDAEGELAGGVGAAHKGCGKRGRRQRRRRQHRAPRQHSPTHAFLSCRSCPPAPPSPIREAISVPRTGTIAARLIYRALLLLARTGPTQVRKKLRPRIGRNRSPHRSICPVACIGRPFCRSCLVRSFAAQLGQRLVRARHPMVPRASGQLAGGAHDDFRCRRLTDSRQL